METLFGRVFKAEAHSWLRERAEESSIKEAGGACRQEGEEGEEGE